MTSLWYEALLVAEEQCVEEGHHEDGRIIIVVYTEQAYAPAVCDECLEYAREIKEQTMTLKMTKQRKLTLVDGNLETEITFTQAAQMFGSDCLMKLTQAINLSKCDIATLDVQPSKDETHQRGFNPDFVPNKASAR